MLIVDTYPDGCEAPPEGSTPVMLVMDEVSESKSCFYEAKNRAASNLGVCANRYGTDL